LVDAEREVALQQRGQSDRLVSQKLRANHRVDQVGRDELEIAIEDAQIVIGAMQHFRDALIRENGSKRRKIEIAQRIDDQVFPGDGDLNQAHLIEIRMERI